MNNKAIVMTKHANKIRQHSLVIIYHAGSGHPGGSLSCADILAYLSIYELGWYKDNFDCQNGNRFILSKGHACPAIYAAAAQAGIISNKALLSFRKLGSPLQGHPHCGSLPWVETSTGSLGQGFSVAVGMALGLRHKQNSARTYVMLGDGELQEGEIWEGAMCAGHYKLDNLCAIIDYNKMQSDDLNENIMSIEPLKAKWEAFKWHVVEIDGHNYDEIDKAFQEAKNVKGKPAMIIAHTIKGKGVSYMDNSPLWHGSVKLSKEDLVQALRDLETPEDEIGGCLDGTNW